MPDLLVVVLELAADDVRAALAEVDRPGQVLRTTTAVRTGDLAADVAAVLGRLDAVDLAARLLSLAVSVGGDVPPADAAGLLAALGVELPEGWGLPAALPVVYGRTDEWAASGAQAASRPAVAGAVVAAARAVGAHAHLPREGAHAHLPRAVQPPGEAGT